MAVDDGHQFSMNFKKRLGRKGSLSVAGMLFLVSFMRFVMLLCLNRSRSCGRVELPSMELPGPVRTPLTKNGPSLSNFILSGVQLDDRCLIVLGL